MSEHPPFWVRFRNEMPVCRKWAYFDHAAVAPLPALAAQAMADWSQQAADEGDTVWLDWHQQVEQARTLAAQLIHASPAEVALVNSTTAGINLVAEGFAWQPGDNVVTLENEFPSNQYPWLNQAWRGVEVRRMPTDDGSVRLDWLANACDSRTRVVSVSWVGYLSGWRLDLNEVAQLAHDRGALLFVDAIQGLGVFPIDVQNTPIDFLAADGHKWMLGPEGAGFFYCRAEHLERLRPTGVGWHSVAHASDYDRIVLDFKPTAARFEGGTTNTAGFIGLTKSLELLLQTPCAERAARVLHVADLLVERLRSLEAELYSPHVGEHRSGIVSFSLPGHDAAALRRKLLSAGVAVAQRSGKLRASPHVYQNEEDVEQLIEGIN
jgi:selenocysteine lyase/cysteine desulfurase